MAERRETMETSDAGQNIEFLATGEEPPRITAGFYHALFESKSRVSEFMEGHKLELRGQIVDGPFESPEEGAACSSAKDALEAHGTILSIYFNIRMTKSGHIQATPTSKYGRSWMIAAGESWKRSDRIGPKMFYGKPFLVRVKTVERDIGGDLLEDSCRYSEIAKILRRLPDNSDKRDDDIPF